MPAWTRALTSVLDHTLSVSQSRAVTFPDFFFSFLFSSFLHTQKRCTLTAGCVGVGMMIMDTGHVFFFFFLGRTVVGRMLT
jgi:hypothetical protein